MKEIFDKLSFESSQRVTKNYSTSFCSAVGMLSPKIRKDIHSIYGFVRLADEIVDSFHDYNQRELLHDFEMDFYRSLKDGISLNPVLNAFQSTVNKYKIDLKLIDAFFKSMKMDLVKKNYSTIEEYKEYIYGSADSVGLMCLTVFVNGDLKKFKELEKSAMHLGSAFQKVNFLRDLKSDTEILERKYFPNIDLNNLDRAAKDNIIEEIELDFKQAKVGILKLPREAKFGVYMAYIYYSRLLRKLKMTPYHKIMESRIRVSNPLKFGLICKAYLNFKFKLI